MGKQQALSREDPRVRRRPKRAQGERERSTAEHDPTGLTRLQQRAGNRAVQRLLAQHSGGEPTELDDETQARVNRERGGGLSLDAGVAAQAGAALGHDFSGVRVHTSPEADSLSRALGARAFTTGKDVFFRAGAYEPRSSSGQELLGHELTHVVQQSSGGGASTGRMRVNPPGDAFEQEADGVAKALTDAGGPAALQRQTPEEEEELVQAQAEEEEEEVQMQEEDEEEEELLQPQLDEEEEQVP